MTLGGFGKPLMALSSSGAWEANLEQLYTQTPDLSPPAAESSSITYRSSRVTPCIDMFLEDDHVFVEM